MTERRNRPNDPEIRPKIKKHLFQRGYANMTDREIRDLVKGESIRIRFTDQMKKRLFQEKEKTGKSVSQIVRQSVDEYFYRHK